MITIIVPVYNAEKTLRQCVDSILLQEHSDFELILVDDGSKDRSPAICDEYEEIDSRVTVIHKKNAGVSAARNKGLEVARGEWICFIDSDDYISSDFLHVVDGCDQHLLITGFRDDIKGVVYDNVKLLSSIYRDADEVRNFIRFQILNNMVLRGPCGKFYRHELLRGQRFNTEMRLGEDTSFVFEYLSKCNTIEVNASSYYVIRRGSIPDYIKYKSSVDYSVRSLSFVWDSFKKMETVHHVGQDCFGTFIGYYKLMCKHEWKSHLALWYRNPDVFIMYRYVFGKGGALLYIKYHIVRLLSLYLK